jgi:4-amino-4-deoxychorismate lyase
LVKFLETIRVEEGRVYNLKWHNLRLNSTRGDFFKNISPLDLREFIKNPPKSGLYRCRVIYSKDIENIEYIPYTPKIFKSFKIVDSDINYSYKYLDRRELDGLRVDGVDEVIVEKGGYLRDTTIANIAFFDGKDWITPKNPLLNGTMRAKLIYEKRLILRDIQSEDLKHFLGFALMNAMIGFQIQKNITIDLKNREKIWF